MSMFLYIRIREAPITDSSEFAFFFVQATRPSVGHLLQWAVRGSRRYHGIVIRGHAALEALKRSLRRYTATDTLIGTPIALPRANNLPWAKLSSALDQAVFIRTIPENPGLIGVKVRYLATQDLWFIGLCNEDMDRNFDHVARKMRGEGGTLQ